MANEKNIYSSLNTPLLIVFLLLCSNHLSAQDVGVIRWDAWVGNQSGVGLEVEESLGPNEFHGRLPYFATIDGPNEVSIQITQSTMDTDLQIAKEAGIDYFAYVYYSPQLSGIGEVIDLHLNSPNKSDVDYCFIVAGNRWNSDVINDLVTNHFSDSSYKKVLNNRPLVYLLRDGDEDGISCQMNSLIAQANAAGFNPYLVGMGSDSFSGVSLDARSDYFVTEKNGVPFSDLVAKAESQWDILKATDNVVPMVTTGYDPRPRNNANNPVNWGGDIPSNFYAAKGTPQEIANHLAASLTWINQNSNKASANTVLMYAWNEFDEGGWICPTLEDGDARLEAIEDVIKGTTSITDITTYPTPIAPVTLPVAGSGGILLNSSFETGNQKNGTPNWFANWPAPWENATRIQKVWKTYTYAGEQAIKVSNRRSATHSPLQDITKALELNGQGNYDVAVMARYYAGNDDIRIVVNTNDGNGSHTFSTPFTNATDSYTLISGTLNITWSGTLNSATIGIESATDYGANLYLDDFNMDLTGGGGIPPSGGVNTLFEAEDATLNGNISVRSVSGASNGFVAGIQTTPSSIEWTINNVPATGSYSVIFGTRSHFGNEGIGSRSATISSSAGSSANYTFPPSETVRQDVITLDLAAGTNTITLNATSTYFEVDYISIPGLTGENVPPFANAGIDQLVEDTGNSGSETVILNGSQSSDIDGNIVSYSWTMGSTEIATGVTPSVDLNAGINRIILTVTDDAGVSSTDVVTVVVAKSTFEAENAILYGDIVTRAVTGASNDFVAGVETTPSSIVWTITDVPDSGNYDITFGTRSHYGYTPNGSRRATISSCSGPSVTYDFPASATVREDVISLSLDEGTNIITLNNDWGYLEVDYMSIAGIAGNNQAPIADAGPDKTVTDDDFNDSENVTLSGSASSDDSAIISFSWTENGTQIASGENTSVPLTIGTHEIVLTVTDDNGISSRDTVTVTVSPATLEAEHATLNGDIQVRALLGASNDSIAGVVTTPSSIVWTVNNVADSGTYDVTFATRSHYGYTANGSRRATISSSVGSSVTYDFPASATIRQDIITLALNQGTNTITLDNDWGYLEVDYISLTKAGGGAGSRLAAFSDEVQDTNHIQDISIYPNPSSGLINISGVKGIVEVFNLLGSKVMEKVAEEGQIIDIDLSGQSGVFIIKTNESIHKVIVRN